MSIISLARVSVLVTAGVMTSSASAEDYFAAMEKIYNASTGNLKDRIDETLADLTPDSIANFSVKLGRCMHKRFPDRKDLISYEYLGLKFKLPTSELGPIGTAEKAEILGAIDNGIIYTTSPWTRPWTARYFNLLSYDFQDYMKAVLEADKSTFSTPTYDQEGKTLTYVRSYEVGNPSTHNIRYYHDVANNLNYFIDHSTFINISDGYDDGKYCYYLD